MSPTLSIPQESPSFRHLDEAIILLFILLMMSLIYLFRDERPHLARQVEEAFQAMSAKPVETDGPGASRAANVPEHNSQISPGEAVPQALSLDSQKKLLKIISGE